MINRPITIIKHVVFGIFKFLLYILRCGRRKRAPVDDSVPTDVVIGDTSNDTNKFQSFPQSSAMSNGYEMQAPNYNQDTTGHPYHSQPNTEVTSQFEEEDLNDSQSWGEWDNGSSSTKDTQSVELPMDQNNKESPSEEEQDFFADMEPTVKVKKIYVKKKQNNVTSDCSGRFSINQDLDFKTKVDLDDWVDEEDNEGGWEDDDIGIEVDPLKVAKEARQMRKKERIMRSEEQKSKHNKDSGNRTKKSKLGTKVS